jgi:hypothetical protein
LFARRGRLATSTTAPSFGFLGSIAGGGWRVCRWPFAGDGLWLVDGCCLFVEAKSEAGVIRINRLG